LTTVTRLDQNMQKAQAYLDKIDEARYSWWTGGHVPDGAGDGRSRVPAVASSGHPAERYVGFDVSYLSWRRGRYLD
jgi:hypothetical protein